ncbi:uncharacterized protein C6orf106 homolog isoform X2 [Dendronephthya gigantea]|uniref:uncharacterized protein C6orf106 homolog isoform X2 n=1 Tax=Dendronephthya gigantea TaxID=151771 RepID=UPI001069C18E|nr:uncharacterized protein C6orf106 homolog isoform X2 [Dendronephthya gigantea]
MAMDVDNEVDQDFLTRFNALGTTDRDILITELQRLLNFQLSHAGCIFFLDMTNWNLQAAVGAYYDFNSSQTVEKLPNMEFMQDITIGEGEAVPPNTKFIKTWRLKNNGVEMWPPGVFLKFTYGDQLGPITFVSVHAVEPTKSTDVSVEMISPSSNGIYQAQWRMCTSMGQYFGDIIWVIISVNESGLLRVTQQFSELGHESRLSPVKPNDQHNEQTPSGFNPFSSSDTPTVPFNSPVKATENENSCNNQISKEDQ